MKKYQILFILYWLCFVDLCSAQGYVNDRLVLGREFAKKHLQVALDDSVRKIKIAKKRRLPTTALPDTITALRAIEPILFRMYGRKVIERQQPYEIYLIDSHWVINGTLPFGYDGGVFLIIVDARNSKVLELSHSQ